ncbi:MAG: DUF624 domain-containing protein [Eubacterium sp.]|nr:DUF624 domain-containing protein [Eubacterium sp.]
MTLFQYHEPNGTGRRLTGIWHYNELLGRDFKRFLTINLLTLLGFLPFILGTIYAVLSSSILVLIPVCILGGAIAGPFLACMYDTVFRSLRDAPGRCIENYSHAFRQNWRQAVIPGIIFCLLLGFYAFMLMMFLWAYRFPGWGTLAVYICSLLFLPCFLLYTGRSLYCSSRPEYSGLKTVCFFSSVFSGGPSDVHCSSLYTGQ